MTEVLLLPNAMVPLMLTVGRGKEQQRVGGEVAEAADAQVGSSHRTAFPLPTTQPHKTERVAQALYARIGGGGEATNPVW